MRQVSMMNLDLLIGIKEAKHERKLATLGRK